MILHREINDTALRKLIKQQEICLGGNSRLKIYGQLDCTSGKRMKRANRVFFTSEKKALKNGYRPCGNCMKNKYKNWKNGSLH